MKEEVQEPLQTILIQDLDGKILEFPIHSNILTVDDLLSDLSDQKGILDKNSVFF